VVKQAKILLQNFPRKHLLAILMGVTFLTVFSLLSNTNLQERETQKDLSSSIEIEDLLTSETTEQLAIRSLINVTAKKND